MKDRYIGENTRLLYDIMNKLEQDDEEGLFFMIDFENAFDSVSWNLINKVLSFFFILAEFLGIIITVSTKISNSVLYNMDLLLLLSLLGAAVARVTPFHLIFFYFVQKF